MGEAPLLGERAFEAFEIAGGLVHVGLLDLDVVEPRRGIHDDLAGLGAFAHDLLVDLGFGGDVDHHVAPDAGLAAEAAAFGEAAFGFVAFLDGVPGGEGGVGDGDAVLREVAVGGRDLAARTDAAPAADAVEIDAELARGGQDRRAGGETPALAGGREDHEGVFVGGHWRAASLGGRGSSSRSTAARKARDRRVARHPRRAEPRTREVHARFLLMKRPQTLEKSRNFIGIDAELSGSVYLWSSFIRRRGRRHPAPRSDGADGA